MDARRALIYREPQSIDITGFDWSMELGSLSAGAWVVFAEFKVVNLAPQQTMVVSLLQIVGADHTADRQEWDLQPAPTGPRELISHHIGADLTDDESWIKLFVATNSPHQAKISGIAISAIPVDDVSVVAP